MWSVVERGVNEHPDNTKDSLTAAIVRVMSDMNHDHLIRACSRFRSRIEADIEAEAKVALLNNIVETFYFYSHLFSIIKSLSVIVYCDFFIDINLYSSHKSYANCILNLFCGNMVTLMKLSLLVIIAGILEFYHCSSSYNLIVTLVGFVQHLLIFCTIFGNWIMLETLMRKFRPVIPLPVNRDANIYLF